MVMFDFLSNYAHFLLLKHPFIAHSVVAIFVKKIVRLHSYPYSTVSDKNKIFISLFWEELFWVLGTQLQCIMIRIKSLTGASRHTYNVLPWVHRDNRLRGSMG